MARVSSEDVKAILSTDLDDLTPFITAANLLVTAELADDELGAELLTEIERWLAAHFACVRDPRAVSIGMGKSSATFEGRQQGGVGLSSTQYGRQALALDTTGKLADIGKTRANISLM